MRELENVELCRGKGAVTAERAGTAEDEDAVETVTAEDEDAEETVTADDKEPGAEAAEDEEEGIVQEAEGPKSGVQVNISITSTCLGYNVTDLGACRSNGSNIAST
ncbi:hypothetical protein M8J76_005237 [Diaphorina citri]|nr:hypothetical protein M8J76_005237 [Diaphorina citri]